MLCILVLSSVPGVPVDPHAQHARFWLPLISNLLHLPLYAGLAVAWAIALLGAARMPAVVAAGVALLMAIGFGMVDELYQGLTPGRETSLGDVLMDTLGAAVGSALFVWHRYRGRSGEA
jgi:VanZ family protein